MLKLAAHSVAALAVQTGITAMRKIVFALVSSSLVLGGCASAAKDVSSSYVSPLQYQGYDCDQIGAEGPRIQGRINQMTGQLDKAANNGKAITGVAVILFWPAVFALGNKTQEAEYARLKGEGEALEQASIAKKCNTATRGPVETVVPARK
jgi:outer membrane murein-binding lipoprotein Lpp